MSAAKKTLSLRAHMMLLFCAAVGLLLAGSCAFFYFALRSAVHTQFDRRLIEAEAPVAADLATDADDEDVVALNIPGEFFETVNSSGKIAAVSKNLIGHGIPWSGTTQELQDLRSDSMGWLRIGVVPVHRRTGDEWLLLAMPTASVDQLLSRVRDFVLIFLPCSLLIMGLVSAWYVGRSLEPISALTEETSRMARQVRISSAAAFRGWANGKPSPTIPSRDDELGRLGEAFNRLFTGMEGALSQLRQFVSDASHELRTPLSVLEGETELVLSQPRKPEEYRRALESIDAELRKLSRIVEGLFTLAMADAGQLQLSREPLYLNEVLEEACALADSRAKRKDIRIERHLGQGLPYSGDEAFLRQLFLIFLENAIKYSPPASRIQVGIGQMDGRVQVQFRDEGAGISPEHLPHIFERFYRAPQPEAGDSQSGGLGLAIAQAIVQAQDGRIDCASEPGKGSQFTIVLPAERQTLPAILAVPQQT